MLGDDDSIYMSLGEIPISMLKIFLAKLFDLNLVIELSLDAMPRVCAPARAPVHALMQSLMLSPFT